MIYGYKCAPNLVLGSPISGHTVNLNSGDLKLALVVAERSFMQPESSLGHTFLVVYTGEKPSLFSSAISFSATQTDERSIKYVFKGLFGGYRAEYKISSLYDKVLEYSFREGRALHFFILDFEEKSIQQILEYVAHSDEIYQDYSFLQNNCADGIFFLLDKNTKSQIQDGSLFFNTPNTVANSVQKNIRGYYIIKPLYQKVAQKYLGLDGAQRKKVSSYLSFENQIADFNTLSEFQDTDFLDAVADLEELAFYTGYPTSQYFDQLVRRKGRPSTFELEPYRYRRHFERRVGLLIDVTTGFAHFNFRPLSYSANDVGNELHLSQFEFFSGSLFRDKRGVFLSRLNLLNLISSGLASGLSPMWNWKVQNYFELKDPINSSYLFNSSLGVGRSWTFSQFAFASFVDIYLTAKDNGQTVRPAVTSLAKLKATRDFELLFVHRYLARAHASVTNQLQFEANYRILDKLQIQTVLVFAPLGNAYSIGSLLYF